MSIHWPTFLSSALGKVVGSVIGALFIAICAAFGFGPMQWAAWVVSGLPFIVTPAAARIVFLILGGLTFLFLAGPPVWRLIFRNKVSKFGAKDGAELARSIRDEVEGPYRAEDRRKLANYLQGIERGLADAVLDGFLAAANPVKTTTPPPPDPNDPETFIQIKDAALEVFTRVDGTNHASSLIALGRTPEGILRLTMWQLVLSGHAWGSRWPKFHEFVYLDKRAINGLSVINDNGDMGTSESDKPLIIGLHVKRAGIEAYVNRICGGQTAVPVNAIPRDLLAGEWIFEFAPASKTQGWKKLSFNDDGTIGLGRNQNEDTWAWETSGTLAIWRKDGSLQNRFEHDKDSGRFISTNAPEARGNKDQVICRPQMMVSR